MLTQDQDVREEKPRKSPPTPKINVRPDLFEES